MKDYSECLINIREFLRRTEECLQAKNAIGAVHHAMNAVNETQNLLDIAIDGTREDE